MPVLAFGWLLTHSYGRPRDGFDDELARRIAVERTPSWDRVAEVATLLGDTIVSRVVAPIVAVGFCIWRRERRRKTGCPGGVRSPSARTPVIPT